MLKGRRIRLAVGASLVAMAAPVFGQVTDDEGAAPQAAQTTSQSNPIIVTAQRRNESIQDVPIAINYVDGAQLERQNITNLTQLELTAPALEIDTQIGSSVVTIRGIGTQGFALSAEQSASVVVDGVVLGRALVDNIFDVDHIEVLSGPQGMLFGKNASAGVINIVTNEPELNELELIGHADIGTYHSFNLRGVANVPLGDEAAVRVSALRSGAGHLIYNAFLNEWDERDELGLRARFLWAPADTGLRINLIGDYGRNTNNGIAYTGVYDGAQTFRAFNLASPNGQALADLVQSVCGFTASPGNTMSCADGAGGDPRAYRVINYGISGQVDLEIGDHTLTSITAFRVFRFGDFDVDTPAYDIDHLPIDVFNRQLVASRVETFSQEARVASPVGQPVEYVVGAYYSTVDSRDQTDQGGTLGIPLPPPLIIRRFNEVNIDSSTAAIFGQLNWNVDEDLTLIAGGRFTHDRLHDVGVSSQPDAFPDGPFIYTPGFELLNVDERISYDNFSWRLGAQYDVTPDVMIYTTVSRGYKAGFVNDQLSLGSIVPVIVDPEYPLAFEAGIKSWIFDRQLLLNVALFHTRIKNFQTTINIPPTAGNPVPSFGTGNASHVITQGVDISFFGEPLEGFSLSGGILINRARFPEDFTAACTPGVLNPLTNQVLIPDCVPFDPAVPEVGFVASNRQIQNAPRWKVTFSAEYEHHVSNDLDFFIQGDLYARSAINLSEGPDPTNRLGAQARIGGRIGIRSSDGDWSLSVFGRNLNGERFLTGMYRDGFNPSDALYQTYTLDSVRLIGAAVDFRF